MHTDLFCGPSIFRPLIAFFTLTIICLSSDNGFTQNTDTLSVHHGVRIDYSLLPTTAQVLIETINVRDADIRDIFRGIGTQYGINIVVDNDINQKVTIRLSDIPVIEAIEFLVEEYGLSLFQSGRILRIRAPDPVPEAVPPPHIINVSMDSEGGFSADLSNDDIQAVVREVSILSERNILLRQGVTGKISGLIRNMPFEIGFSTLLANNGYTLRERDGVFVVDRVLSSVNNESYQGAFWVNVADSLVSIDVTGIPTNDVLREIAIQSNLNVITYTLPTGLITAKFVNQTVDQALNLIFKGTNITFRRDGDVYFVGDKGISGIATSRLLRLNHIRSDGVLDILPDELRRNTTIRVVREQNALMVIGTNDMLFEIESFISLIDRPTPQILIEALVVDFEDTDIFELGVMLGTGPVPDTSFFGNFMNFGGELGNSGLTLQADGSRLNRIIGSDSEIFGTRIGVLPTDFYVRMRALSQEGRVNVRSRPQISTLNGHSATITIGTTQYYLLKSTTPLQSPNQIVTQESERFEKIDANVSLTITPWVSASGEVTAEILPVFNTPVGRFEPNVPPTINTRVLESTVRLRDGETIILGGLIQDSEVTVHNKVPILGDIPLLGRLFRNRSRETIKSELVIFITPHVFYGDEFEADKWRELSRERGQ